MRTHAWVRSAAKRGRWSARITPKGRDERSERVNPTSSEYKTTPSGGFFLDGGDENPRLGSLRSEARTMIR